jgi:hypothetical protein
MRLVGLEVLVGRIAIGVRGLSSPDADVRAVSRIALFRHTEEDRRRWSLMLGAPQPVLLRVVQFARTSPADRPDHSEVIKELAFLNQLVVRDSSISEHSLRAGAIPTVVALLGSTCPHEVRANTTHVLVSLVKSLIAADTALATVACFHSSWRC